MSKTPGIKDLLEAGAHFGHQSRRWNPKMASYIFADREGIHIIDLEKTEKKLEQACNFIKEVASKGGAVIFLSTKRQAQEIIKREASRVDTMYLTHRWLGGLLTNFSSVKKTIDKLPALEKRLEEAKEEGLTKREQLLISREIAKLEKNIGGIRGLEKLPEAIFIVDSRKEEIAVREANKTGVPVVAIVDTNADPTKVEYPIPANDDAIKAISLLVKTIADAFEEGRRMWEKKAVSIAKKEAQEAKEKVKV